MRNANILTVLNCIRASGPVAKRGIQAATGLSWGTVSSITAELIEKRLLMECTPPDGSIGRPPVRLDICSTRNYIVGLDINIAGLSALLIDLKCGVRQELHEKPEILEKDRLLEQISGLVRRLIGLAGIPGDSLLGIGIAVQGSVDSGRGISLFSPFFSGWKDVPLRDLFEKEFQVPVMVIHDPNCMAMAEQWIGQAQNTQNFILLRLSTGLGMSFVNGGAILDGATGTAGEIGHMVVDPDGPLCSCGNRGCLESFSSIRGILARVKEACACGELDPGRRYDASIKDAAAGAREGNRALLQIFEDCGFYLGVGVANLINLFNPALILMAGELADYQDLFFQKMLETVRRHAWHLSPIRISFSSLHASAAMGAAIFFVKQVYMGEIGDIKHQH